MWKSSKPYDDVTVLHSILERRVGVRLEHLLGIAATLAKQCYRVILHVHVFRMLEGQQQENPLDDVQ